MHNEVTNTITSCHDCEEFKPRWWELFNPLNYPMRFWGAAGYCKNGNFYIPSALHGNIPATCPKIKRGET